MRNILFFALLTTVGGLACCCSDKEKDRAVRIEKQNGEKLYVCDYSKLKDDTLTLKLSDLIDSFEVIKLDNDTNAMVGGGWVHCSDHYLMLRPNRREPFKLFSRQGKYLCDIGTIGRGPGEYTVVDHAQLDEKNSKIYILARQQNQLLVYDLQGKLTNSISFPTFLPMAKFKVEDDKVSVLSIPFIQKAQQANKWIAFQQTLYRKILDTIPKAPYVIPIEYADWLNFNPEFMSFHIYQWSGLQDTLYHYLPGKGRLTPVFTVDYGGSKKIPLHEYHEIQGFFWFTTYTLKELPNGQFTNKAQKRILINKKTLEAGSLKIENDIIGGDLAGWNFEGGYGYYSENLHPLKLKERLEKFSKKEGLSEKSQKLVNDLLSQINEEDNNYILLGKIKESLEP